MKFFLVLVTALFSLNSFAEENQSLHQFMTKNYDWKKDPSHVVHVGTRCATVMDAAVWRLSADNRDSVKAMSGQYKNIGDVYMYSTASLAQTINYTSDGYTKLYKSWMDTYKTMGEENAIKYNEFFYGMLGEDFKTCGEPSNFQFFKLLLEAEAKNKK